MGFFSEDSSKSSRIALMGLGKVNLRNNFWSRQIKIKFIGTMFCTIWGITLKALFSWSYDTYIWIYVDHMFYHMKIKSTMMNYHLRSSSVSWSNSCSCSVASHPASQRSPDDDDNENDNLWHFIYNDSHDLPTIANHGIVDRYQSLPATWYGW